MHHAPVEMSFIAPFRTVVAFARSLVFVALLVATSACASRQKGDEADEKIVPESTQQESRELQGQQEMMMDYNATPADQAAARHEDRTKPVRRPEREK